jgi:hypothetical protein
LEKILHMMTLSIMPLVILRRILFVGLRRNAGLQSERFEKSAKCCAAIGFVGKDRSGCLPFDEFRCGDAVVTVSGSEENSNAATLVIDQRMDLRVGTALGFSNALEFSASHASECVFMDFRAAGINRPELPARRLRERIEDAVPHSRFTPPLPIGVDRGVRGEDAQSTPGTTLPQSEKNSLQNALSVGRWSASLRILFGCASTRAVLVNFFSRFALAASFGWMRMFSMPELTLN